MQHHQYHQHPQHQQQQQQHSQQHHPPPQQGPKKVKKPKIEEKEKKGDDDVDGTFAHRNVWLVKVPGFLCDHWNEAEPNSLLGKLVHKETPGGYEIQVQLAQTEGGFPKDFTFVVKKDSNDPIELFSEEPNGSLAFEGKVDMRAEIRPTLNAEYAEFCKQRNTKANTKTRQTQSYEGNPNANLRNQARFNSSFISQPRRRASSPVADKRERMKKDDLMDLIFSIFEREPYWSLKSLVNETNQPQAYLKEVLGELCIFNKKGPNKSLYELKPEYKKKENFTVSSSSTTTGGGQSGSGQIVIDDDGGDGDDDDEEHLE
eukprot:TRINITY_DN2682_c0_g1_i2.p1 TRINITY_DN2682_c0_g1~~TRINITY_DN2682_c0_g1_i2.p1  ORF type:complete len:316 (-),score=121.13 TRINITY_DN2682_c0_g1_i2:161-1108(-)